MATLEERINAARKPTLEERLSQIPAGEIIPRSSQAQRLFENTPTQQIRGRQQLIPGVSGFSAPLVGRQTDPERGGARAAGRGFLTQAVGNLANIPQTLLDLTAASPERVAEFERRRGQPFTPEQAQRFTQPSLPIPSGEQIIAGGETGAEALGRTVTGGEIDLNQMFGKNLADARLLAAEHPGATTVGETGADVATILTGRAPLARLRAPGQKARREAAESQARQRIELPEGVEDEITDVLTQRIAPFLKETGRLTRRAAGKSFEAGLEGAVLAALDEGDPSTTFGLAAGGQAAGSASLFLVEKPVKRLLPFVATAFVASEMFKAAAPGEQNFFESKDFAIQKAVAALGLGLVASLAGAGRLRGQTAERFPALFDAVTAVPRSAILSRVAELTKASEEGNELPLNVMQRYAHQPDFFNKTQQDALGRALQSPDEGAFTKEVERLMKTDNFRKRVQKL